MMSPLGKIEQTFSVSLAFCVIGIDKLSKTQLNIFSFSQSIYLNQSQNWIIIHQNQIHMKLIILTAIFIFIASADDFYYTRVLECFADNSNRCIQWKQSSLLRYFASYSTYCFSSNAHLLTSEGPRPMNQLKIGDLVLGINPQTGTKTYSKIQAWLHRDEDAIVQYQIIATDEGTNFESSDFHNIGVVNKDGKIDFKFAKDLVAGDKLVSFPVQNLEVSSASVHQQKQGLFSPFTQNGNYFVFHTDFDPNNGTEQSMILAHALSQVSDPTSQMATAQRFISLWGTLSLNSDPNPHEHYTHPLILRFSFLFWSHWQGQAQKIKYLINGEQDHDQARPSYSTPSYPSSPSYYPSNPYSSPSSYSNSYSSRPSYGSSSYSSYPSYGYNSYSYSSYNSGCGYYSSNNNCNSQQQKQNQMKKLGLSISIIQELPLL